ncbi:MAG: hypothetical protein ACQEV6_01480 [Pseudomonadota bacterium]
MSNSKNAELEHTVSEWTQNAQSAETPEDLYQVTSAMVDYGSPIKFDLGKLYGSSLVLFLLAAGAFYMNFNAQNFEQWMDSLSRATGFEAGRLATSIIATLAVASFILFSIANKKDALIDRLAATIMDRAALIQYNMRRIDSGPIVSLIKNFGELQRGNYERDIRQSYEGHYSSEDHSFQYRAFRLHYVDEIKEEVYNQMDDKWETETKYEHYDRSGIVLDFPYAAGIHICNNFETTLYGAPYKPASLEFDKKFHCRGQDGTTLARFLKPGVVQTLSEAAQKIPKLTVEINKNRQLCLGCARVHVVQTTQKLTPDTNPKVNPKGFDEFIRAQTQMPDLDRLLALAHTLIRYSDSNFSRKST